MNRACCDNLETVGPAQTAPAGGWRAGLRALGLAPVRLHRFRNLRTRLLHEALCERDCWPDRAGAAGQDVLQ